MNFQEKYLSIKNVTQNELSGIEKDLEEIFDGKTLLDNNLRDFLCSNAKRIRPVLAILFGKALYEKINCNQKNAICAIELIHNATLIHDDIIDNSETRRGTITFNKKFDNKLAVIAGDFLLSIAMEKIISTKSIKLIEMCTNAIKKLCIGEINQFFKKYKIMNLEEYIEKSKNKTAELFMLGLESVIMLSDTKSDNALFMAKEFSENFGIAFQLRDDLINFTNEKMNKNSDVKNGIYTAPVILADCERRAKRLAEVQGVLDPFNASDQEADCERRLEGKTTLFPEMPFNASDQEADFDFDNIHTFVNKFNGLEKTRDLVDTYFEKALVAINDLEESIYKNTLIKLVNLLKDEI